MKIFYVPKMPLGDFVYDPSTHRGVGISEQGFLVVDMDGKYDPHIHPTHRELEVPDDFFSKFLDAISRYQTAETEIGTALLQLPRDAKNI